MRNLTDLPKAHLHVHLFGSIRRSTISELAARDGMSTEAVDDLIHQIESVNDMDSFQIVSQRVQRILSTAEDVERVCREFIEDEVSAGVVHTEPSFVPHDFARRFGLSPEALFERMDRAFRDAARGRGITVAYVISPNRGREPGYLNDAARFAVSLRNSGVVAFGYGGQELWGHERMVEAVAIARAGGLRIDPHAGEVLGPESVREAIALIHPDRLAHAVTSVNDPEVVSDLVRLQIPCNVSLGSNAGLRVVADLADHPLPRMLDAKIVATLNADDTTFFLASVLEEFVIAREVLGFDDHRLATLARNSIRAAVIPEPERRHHLARITAWERSPGVNSTGGAALT